MAQALFNIDLTRRAISDPLIAGRIEIEVRRNDDAVIVRSSGLSFEELRRAIEEIGHNRAIKPQS